MRAYGNVTYVCRAEEIMAPILAFKSSGCDVSVYSPAGGKIPIDEASLNPPFRTEEVDKFLEDGAASTAASES